MKTSQTISSARSTPLAWRRLTGASIAHLSPTLSEKRRHNRQAIRIGFVALTDCAPLVMAQESGFFSKYGLKVELVREVGWATVRDPMRGRRAGWWILVESGIATPEQISADSAARCSRADIFAEANALRTPHLVSSVV